MRKLRLREVCGLAQGPAAVRSSILPPGLSASKACVLSSVLGEGRQGFRAHSFSPCNLWNPKGTPGHTGQGSGCHPLASEAMAFNQSQSYTRILNPLPSREAQHPKGDAEEKFFFFFFGLFRAALRTYGCSQAKGQIGATAAGLHHSHSNPGSELPPTPQFMAAPRSLTH